METKFFGNMGGKRSLDAPVVFVRDGDVEGAARILRRRLVNSGLFKQLKTRRENPSAADRRRAKKRASSAFAKRRARRRALAWSRDRD